jgi:hypothetical protein
MRAETVLVWSVGMRDAQRTYLSSAILGSALGCGQLSPSLGATLARVAVVRAALAHVVGGAANGRVDGVWWASSVRVLGMLGVWRVLGERLHAGLASAGSEQMFS